MKRTFVSASVIAVALLSLISLSSFNKRQDQKLNQHLSFRAGGNAPVTIHTSITGAYPDGTTFTGTVSIIGAISQTGTFVMQTEALGMALHCNLVLELPDGTLTIRMNCNMGTLNGRCKILSGTGAYENVKGEGSLVMPVPDEIMIGVVSGT
jgi:hypothetical protein